MDPFARAQHNAFVSHAVDRVHSRRVDASWLTDSQSSPNTRYVVVWQDEILLQSEAGYAPTPDQGDLLHLQHYSKSELTDLQQQCPGQPADVVLLGTLGDVTYFAVGIGDTCDVVGRGLCNGGQFLDLRGAATRLDHEEGALAAQAKAMVHWHRQHRFCGHCGSPMQSEEGGYQLRCTNDACGQVHFPRVDPAIIVLVVSGERCLLGRQPRWPGTRYSNIAGYVEPGESLETAVAREVAEEAGVVIRSVEYHSSQPWPFPQALMVGFTAEAETDEIRLNDGELEDARWFTRAEMCAGLASGSLSLPSPTSISFHLIEDWFDQGGRGTLRTLVAETPG